LDKSVLGISLTRKNNSTKSCGCSRKGTKPWTLENGIASLNKKITGYIERAKNKNIEYNLTYDIAKKIIDGKCNYCGVYPFREFIADKSCNGSYIGNGIDRFDNLLGYTKENCVTACWNCNSAKGQNNIEFFQEWIKRITSNFDKVKDWNYDVVYNPATREIYSKYRYATLSNNILWDLEYLYFSELIQQKCHYCGTEPNVEKFSNKHFVMQLGIDKINSQMGYTKANVVPCCWTCNKAKLNLSLEEFTIYIKRLAYYNYDIK